MHTYRGYVCGHVRGTAACPVNGTRYPDNRPSREFPPCDRRYSAEVKVKFVSHRSTISDDLPAITISHGISRCAVVAKGGSNLDHCASRSADLFAGIPSRGVCNLSMPGIGTQSYNLYGEGEKLTFFYTFLVYYVLCLQ